MRSNPTPGTSPLAIPFPVVLFLAFSLGLAGCDGGSSSGFQPSPDPDPDPDPPGDPPQLAAEQVFTSVAFNEPLAMLQAPGDDSRWFVVERAGMVAVFPNIDDPVADDVETFVDLTAGVNSGPREAGMLGMAFHPDFATNGQVFLSYTSGPPLTSRISRFRVDGSTGLLDAASEDFVLTVEQPNTNHNGGNIVFGPDGFLYIAFGDGGGAGDPGGNGQDPTNLFGTILRIDVDGADPYAIPSDNPFAGNTECREGASSGMMPCPEIFAFGFRNPWRFSFDRETGELWVGDVGENSWEEINRVESSMNYGWNEREGAHCFEPPTGCDTDNVDPITEYDHSLGQSVTGGYVYRGDAFPELRGFYLFADFVSGRIWGVAFDSPIGTEPQQLTDTPLSIASFAQGNDGELYVLDFSGGTIHRIVAN